MPRLTTIKNLIEAEMIQKIEQETPKIPESDLPSSKCEPADHSMCDFLFEDYKDGKGRLMWKAKLYRLDAEQNKKFREMLIKDLEQGENKNDKRS